MHRFFPPFFVACDFFLAGEVLMAGDKMAEGMLTSNLKEELVAYLGVHKAATLVDAYLFYLEKKFSLAPVLFPREKRIYQSTDELVKHLEAQNGLCHETEIKISFGDRAVDENTKRIYICPFTGKVFGDNTHPNPQDAIYDWVSKCPENTERSGGLPVKRFYVSEDPEVINNYRTKEASKEPITKVVYSSALSGKLFNSRAAVTKDFKRNYVKALSLEEVQNQNRFEIEEHFMAFLEEQLNEERVTAFVETLAEHSEFHAQVERWIEG